MSIDCNHAAEAVRVWWSPCVSHCFSSSFFPCVWHSARLSPRWARLPFEQLESGRPTSRPTCFPGGRWLQGPARRHTGERVGGRVAVARARGFETGRPTLVSQPPNLIIATLGSKNLLELASADGTRLELKPEQDFSRSASAPAARCARRCLCRIRYPHAAARLRRLRRPRKRRRRLILEHEPGERRRTARLTASLRPKLLCQSKRCWPLQEKSVIGVLFVTDVHNHPDPVNFEAAARRILASAAAAAHQSLHAGELGRPRPHSSRAGVTSNRRNPGSRDWPPARGLSKAAETARGFQSIPLDGVEVALRRGRQSSRRGQPRRRQVHRGIESEAEG